MFKDESTDSDCWNILSVLSICHKYIPVNCKNVYSSSNVDKQWAVFKNNNNNNTVTGIVSSVSSTHTYHREIICLVSQSYNICLLMHLTAAADWSKRSGEPQTLYKIKSSPSNYKTTLKAREPSALAHLSVSKIPEPVMWHFKLIMLSWHVVFRESSPCYPDWYW